MTCHLLAAVSILAQPAVDAQPPLPSAPLLEVPTGSSTYLDIDFGVGYATNPFLSFDGDTGRAFGRVGLHGVHLRRSARSSTMISAFAENTSYVGRYGSQVSYRLDASHDFAVSETLRLFGGLQASSDRGDQLGTRIVSIPAPTDLPDPTLVIPGLPVPGNDLTSLTGRQYRLGARLGGQLALNARDSLTATSGYEHVFLRGGLLDQDYSSLFGSLAWDRRLNERATAGARLSVNRMNFESTGETVVVTPQITGRLLLSERTELSGAVGLSFASIDDGVEQRTSTGLSVQGAYCRRGEQDRLCAQFSREEQAATIAGPVRSTAASLDYSRSLNEGETVEFSMGASRNSRPFDTSVTGDPIGDASYLRASSGYTRRLKDRWFAGADVAVRKFLTEGPDPDTDVGISIFLRHRLGDLR